MKIKDGFLLRQVGGNQVVVPVGAQTVDFRCIITLNETGAFLWQRLQQPATQDGLVEALLEEYDVTDALIINNCQGAVSLRSNLESRALS